MPALLDDVKAAVKMTKPEPEAPESAFNVDFLQAYVNQMVRGMPLPVVNPQAPPLEEYTDEGKRKMRPRGACKVDARGVVEFGSGPVVTDDLAAELWARFKHIFEQCVHKTLYCMSESILDPERKGVIDERSKVIHAPEGRIAVSEN